MRDRQKLEALLKRRFPEASQLQIAAAANAIMGLDDEWDEAVFADVSELAHEIERGAEFRFLRRRSL